MAQPKVFVSHSHLDDAFAERLVKDLRAAGADAWLDKEDVGAGDFQERISAALDKCEWFVLVLTENALASPWVTQEFHAANRLKHQKRIRDLILIKAESVEPRKIPALWGVYNIFDATTGDGAAQSRMLKALGLSPTPQPAAPQRASQRAPQPQAPVPAVAPQRTPSVAGEWKEVTESLPWMFAITQNGQTLTGAVAVNHRPASGRGNNHSITGRISGEEITFEFDFVEGQHYAFNLRLFEGNLVGTELVSNSAGKAGLPVTLVRH